MIVVRERAAFSWMRGKPTMAANFRTDRYAVENFDTVSLRAWATKYVPLLPSFAKMMSSDWCASGFACHETNPVFVLFFIDASSRRDNPIVLCNSQVSRSA